MGAAVTVLDSTVAHNTASIGGGIYATRTLTLTGSTVLANIATSGSGGGIFTASENACVFQNDTIANNQALAPMSRAGGLYVGDGNSPATATVVENCTIVGNVAGAAGGGVYSDMHHIWTVASSVIAGNTAAGAADDITGYNVVVTNCVIGAPTGLSPYTGSANNLPYGTDPRLGPLQDNGGLTLTRLPSPEARS